MGCPPPPGSLRRACSLGRELGPPIATERDPMPYADNTCRQQTAGHHDLFNLMNISEALTMCSETRATACRQQTAGHYDLIQFNLQIRGLDYFFRDTCTGSSAGINIPLLYAR